MNGLRILSPPSAEPLHLSEVKKYLRVDHSEDDELLALMLSAARQRAEAVTRRAFLFQTLELSLDGFPTLSGEPIELPRPPLLSLVAVRYIDTAGVQQTWDSSNYQLDTSSLVARLRPKPNVTWPSTLVGKIASVKIEYQAGHETPVANVNLAGNALVFSSHAFVDGDRVRLHNSGGALPSPLAANTDYYVVGSTPTSISLSTSAGGAAITLLNVGNGQHYVAQARYGTLPGNIRLAMLNLVAGDYDQRGTAAQASDAVMRLLWPHRVL